MPNAKLVKEGRNYNATEVVADANVILDSARKVRTEVPKITDADLAAIVAGLKKVNDLLGTTGINRTITHTATETEEQRRARADKWLDELDRTLPHVLDKIDRPPRKSEFNRGRAAASTPLMVKHLKRIQKNVVRLDTFLEAFMSDNGKPSEILAGLVQSLETADLVQKDGQRGNVVDTAELNEAKAVLAEAIRVVQTKARNKLDGDEAKLKLFKTTFDARAPSKKKTDQPK